MINAKTELLELLTCINCEIKCANIAKNATYLLPLEEATVINLSLNYTLAELSKFFDKLDFTYDEGYGGQELFGTVWLTDGTWLSRGEYDGSEWWNHNTIPVIPDELLTNN